MLRKYYPYIVILIVLSAIGGLCFKTSKREGPTRVGELLTVSDTTIRNTPYKIFNPGALKLSFTLSRPDKSTSGIYLSAPGAYTDLNTFGVDGLHIVNGMVYNRDRINAKLGGGVIIHKDSVRIFDTEYGKLLTNVFIDSLSKLNASFFQQTVCVLGNTAEGFRDTKLFRRRGIISRQDGSYAIVESAKPITLRTFSEDMVILGASELLNLDMGAWDEGWYRAPGSNKVIITGTDRSQTARQTNWIVLEIRQ